MVDQPKCHDERVRDDMSAAVSVRNCTNQEQQHTVFCLDCENISHRHALPIHTYVGNFTSGIDIFSVGRKRLSLLSVSTEKGRSSSSQGKSWLRSQALVPWALNLSTVWTISRKTHKHVRKAKK